MYIDAWTQKADVLSDLNSFANCLISMALGLTMVTKTEETANSLNLVIFKELCWLIVMKIVILQFIVEN